jgi:hypothetical protein
MLVLTAATTRAHTTTRVSATITTINTVTLATTIAPQYVATILTAFYRTIPTSF